MRFEQATIRLAPRRPYQCLDLAFILWGRHLVPVLQIWAIAAGPFLAAHYLLASYGQTRLYVTWLLWYASLAPLEALLLAAAVPSAFGAPFQLAGALATLRRCGVRLLAVAVLSRLTILVSLLLGTVAGLWVAAWLGFLTEATILNSLEERGLHDRSATALARKDLGDLVSRLILISLFGLLVAIVLFATLDFAFQVLLAVPLFTGRLEFGDDWISQAFALLWSDPAVTTLQMAALTLAYLPCRLAWWLCYVDARVRRRLWDMELQMLQQADRLAGVPEG